MALPPLRVAAHTDPNPALVEASRLAMYVFKFDSPHCSAASFRDALRLHGTQCRGCTILNAATSKPTVLDARLHGDSDGPSGRRRVPTRRLTRDRRRGPTECECEMHLAEVGFQPLPSPSPVRLCQCDAACTSEYSTLWSIREVRLRTQATPEPTSRTNPSVGPTRFETPNHQCSLGCLGHRARKHDHPRSDQVQVRTQLLTVPVSLRKAHTSWSSHTHARCLRSHPRPRRRTRLGLAGAGSQPTLSPGSPEYRTCLEVGDVGVVSGSWCSTP